MGISSQRTSPKKRRERSIFGSIFNSTMLVVLVEVLLLVASIYLMRVGPQLNQNAEDILNYKACKKNLPSVGQIVKIPEGKGKVISVDILKQSYKVNIDDKGIIEVKICNECS